MPANGESLVIGPGGGRDVWSALVFGARRVVGVEINSIIVNDVMRDRFSGRSGRLYDRPDVEIHVDDGRNFIARSRERYDVIQASLVDTWAATSAGAFSLTENNLYTVEAFVEYLQHLRPGGVLAFSRWTQEGVRVLSLARTAAERMGWTVSDRFFAVERRAIPRGEPGVTTYMLRTTPFTPDENRRLREAAHDLGFRIIYAPPLDGQPAEGDPQYVTLATTADADAIYRRHETDISPVVDDRPFFFQGVKPSSVPKAFRDAALTDSRDGISLLVRLLYVSIALVLAFIVVPLVFRGGAPTRELPLGWLAYFSCLGVGFMLIEIGLMQRIVLFLGHPVYALTVVLFTLLIGGAIGSRVSRRPGAPRRLTPRRRPRHRLRVRAPALVRLVAGVRTDAPDRLGRRAAAAPRRRTGHAAAGRHRDARPAPTRTPGVGVGDERGDVGAGLGRGDADRVDGRLPHRRADRGGVLFRRARAGDACSNRADSRRRCPRLKASVLRHSSPHA